MGCTQQVLCGHVPADDGHHSHICKSVANLSCLT